MNVLVFNVGSTTLKFACVDTSSGKRLTEGLIDRIGQPGGDAGDHLSAAKAALDQHRSLSVDAIGHRIVQGGAMFQTPALVTPSVIADLRTLDSFAPLHNPPARSVVEAIDEMKTGLGQVLVFDTAFFATLAPAAYRYAIPESVYVDHGVRRYGAHGTSHRFVTKHAIEYLSKRQPALASNARIVSLHLGGGASATASVGGVAVDTSMGMTPLEGLVMATRSGDIDPSVPLHLIRNAGMTADQVDRLLNKSSGLLGLCGDCDMRSILNRRDEGDDAASLAIDIYIHRLVKMIGGYVAEMGGVDALIFTAGVGENSAEIRRLATERLQHLGIKINASANQSGLSTDAVTDISDSGAAAKTLIVRTNEELEIAVQTAFIVG
ncbi:acetate/propionate family kinase [Rubripirellula reticaptiva]|uniref:Acetate kinase n=1 Tax=Rubripirellula reticaptiva TaxID=2528013 RepID=A0A5C6F687_9BACT|nr:acetate/propionate family kinase [Rubripirellula reticaptiva]TWU56080.1 Acetate kinase [Rubripirellula reticaptiva]